MTAALPVMHQFPPPQGGGGTAARRAAVGEAIYLPVPADQFKEALIKSGERRCRANFRRIKAQKVQEYFVYFKLFATQSRRKFVDRCRRRINQRFLNSYAPEEEGCRRFWKNSDSSARLSSASIPP